MEAGGFDDRRSLFRALYRTNQRLSKAARLFGLTEEEMGLALQQAALRKLIQTTEPDPDKPRVGRPPRPTIIVPPPAQRAMPKTQASTDRRWCEQCDRLVEVREADRCASQWCKARAAA